MSWDNQFAVAWRKKLQGNELEYLEGEVEKLQEAELDTI